MKRHVSVDLGAVAAILVGLGLAVGVLTALPGRRTERVTLRELERRFGPKRYSELNEELVIRDFFRERQYGFFVDVGAGHYLQGRNTYFLESEQHWRGIAVDGIADSAGDYLRHRPQTRFFPLFVAQQSGPGSRFLSGDQQQDAGVRDRTRDRQRWPGRSAAGPYGEPGRSARRQQRHPV